MKKVFLVLGVVLYIFAAVSYCYSTADKITPEPPAIATYTPTESKSESVLIANMCVATSEPVEVIEPRYGFTDAEVYLLAQLLCGGANISGDGEYDFVWKGKVTNYCEMSKVLCVVMNRVRSGSFPNTVTEVVMQKGQFSNICRSVKKVPDQLAVDTIKEWCDAYDNWDIGAQSIPENHLYFSAGPNLTNITREKY